MAMASRAAFARRIIRRGMDATTELPGLCSLDSAVCPSVLYRWRRCLWRYTAGRGLSLFFSQVDKFIHQLAQAVKKKKG
jgi:hypothetical protein